jgi:hypothetical protein
MDAATCPECLLTPAAARLIGRLVEDLGRRGNRGRSLEQTICPTCGEVTAVGDAEQGWAIGEVEWSREADGAGDRPDPFVDEEVPDWVTVREAAFVLGLDAATIEGWLAAGLVEHEVVLRGSSEAGVLVRLADLHHGQRAL